MNLIFIKSDYIQEESLLKERKKLSKEIESCNIDTLSIDLINDIVVDKTNIFLKIKQLMKKNQKKKNSINFDVFFLY